MRLALPAASEAELSCCQPDQMWQAVTASFWASSRLSFISRYSIESSCKV